jgi:hypothetical protein
MTIRLYVTIAALALGCAGPALAAGGEAPTQRSQTADSQQEVVCQVQRVTGSRLAAKRVCMTRAQWADQRRQQREDVQRAQGSRTGPDITG